MKLASKAVAALSLPAGKTDVIHFDDTMPGFGYRVRLGAGGKVLRSWICQYKRAGRTSRMLLGNAEVIGAEQARLAAKKALGAVAMGQDPAGDRRARRDRDGNTMRALVEEFLAAKERQLRPRSFVELKRYLTTGYFKPLHSMPVDTITRRDVSARILGIAHESGDPTAVRAKEALSNFFVWARRMGLCEQNPTIDTAQPEAGKPRERVLDDSELSAIWRAAGGDEYGKIVRLLILTGCRRAEIGDTCWSEIDLDKGTWTLPGQAFQKRPSAHVADIAGDARDHRERAEAGDARSAVRPTLSRLHSVAPRQAQARPALGHHRSVAAARHPPQRRNAHV
jgi:integrase